MKNECGNCNMKPGKTVRINKNGDCYICGRHLGLVPEQPQGSQPNLQSTTNKLGRYVTQIFHGTNGQVRTFHGVDTTKTKDGQMCKLFLKDGRMLLVNRNNMDIVEVIAE